MMSSPRRDKITPVLDLMRSRQYPLALERSRQTDPDHDAGEAQALSHCARLAEWYLAGLEGRVEEGLSEAVTAVSRLSEAGWRNQLGFAYGSIGFVFGLLGDFETGLEWLEVAIQDAHRRNDQEQLAGVISQKGGVLGFTEEYGPPSNASEKPWCWLVRQRRCLGPRLSTTSPTRSTYAPAMAQA